METLWHHLHVLEPKHPPPSGQPCWEAEHFLLGGHPLVFPLLLTKQWKAICDLEVTNHHQIDCHFPLAGEPVSSPSYGQGCGQIPEPFVAFTLLSHPGLCWVPAGPGQSN